MTKSNVFLNKLYDFSMKKILRIFVPTKLYSTDQFEANFNEKGLMFF